jgi:hypothetical protein
MHLRITINARTPLVRLLLEVKGRLFSDTVKGAIAGAMVYALVETRRANGVELHARLQTRFLKTSVSFSHVRSARHFGARDGPKSSGAAACCRPDTPGRLDINRCRRFHVSSVYCNCLPNI